MRSVGEVWRVRERIEHEAATHFDWIGERLEEEGQPAELVTMARSAAEDEREHAVRCRALVELFAPGLPPLEVPRTGPIGPSSLPGPRRTLYATVAVGCVTESLSCGLLLAMRARATHPQVSETIQHILRDEVRHSRLGWAHLALSAERSDVSWLAGCLRPMLDAALADEVVPMCVDEEAPGLGVLTHEESREVVAQTITQVIAPGLAAHGVQLPTG